MDKTVKRSMLGLIEALEAQPHRPGPKTWQEFEDHVQHVYQTLLRLEGQTIMVAKDVCLVGSKGDEYQIDVYYEFEVAGLRHRVAIECKNRSRPIERDDVIAFNGKIRDCLDVRGVIVTANGFQSGARKHAEDNGLTALTMDELPSLGRLLGMELRHNTIPSEAALGAPFWAIFDMTSAAPYGASAEEGPFAALLFWSKQQAAKYRARNRLESKWQVRGLELRHLVNFILVVDSCDGRFAVAPSPHHELAQDCSLFSFIPRSVLIDEFCPQFKQKLKTRMVLPGADNGRRPK